MEADGNATEFVAHFERIYVSELWPMLFRSQGAVMVILVCLKNHRKTLFPITNGSAPHKWAAAAATQIRSDFPSSFLSAVDAEKFVNTFGLQ